MLKNKIAQFDKNVDLYEINCFSPKTATIIIVITNKLVLFAIIKQCLSWVLIKNCKNKPNCSCHVNSLHLSFTIRLILPVLNKITYSSPAKTWVCSGLLVFELRNNLHACVLRNFTLPSLNNILVINVLILHKCMCHIYFVLN